MTLRITAALLVSGLCVAAQGWAQSTTTGSIAGSVKDATGAVLPGVTVDAASPALIEKTRSAVTDGQGNYKILDLRPGTYTVTFTLTGFATVKREGLELTTGFTANVGVEMRLGAVSETITVTGATPVVDVQNVRYQQVLTREVLDVLPTGGKNIQSYVALTLGANLTSTAQDVGGTSGDRAGTGAFTYRGVGNNDQQLVVDGMNIQQQQSTSAPSARSQHQNPFAFEETTIGSGTSAEQYTGGLLLNLIPRDGGNKFSGTFGANGSASSLQSNNITDDLRARGVPTPASLLKLYDVGGGFGGPIKKDKLWFYGSDRTWNSTTLITGSYRNATPMPAYGFLPVYTPDLSNPGVSGTPHHDDDARITWQLTGKQKLAFLTELQQSCTCGFSVSSLRAPEAGQNLTANYAAASWTQGTWSWVKSNTLLIEAGDSSYFRTARSGGIKRPEGVSNTAIPLRDLNTGFAWNASGSDPTPFGTCCTPFSEANSKGYSQAHDQKFSVTRSTGSHSFKAGLRLQEAFNVPSNTYYNITPWGAVALSVRGGVSTVAGVAPPPPVPAAVLVLLNPQGPASQDVDNGKMLTLLSSIYAQDQWVMKRLTLNLGLRYDGMYGRWNTLTVAGNDLVGPQTFPEATNAPNWKDISPRIGGAYDLFGTGKTAVKASIARYVSHQTDALNSPLGRLGMGDAGGTRTWNDSFYPVGDARRGNFAPDCDLRNPIANGECGPQPNINRGIGTAPSLFYDPDFIAGFGARPYYWSSSVAVQHELLAGVALNAGYFRTRYGNITVTDNRAVTPADYSPFCVTAPTDERLGPTSGRQLCGLYDLNPSKVGLVDNYVTYASKFGDPSNVFNGVDVSVNARFAKGAFLQGGISTSKNNSNDCFVIDSPQRARPDFCTTTPPWSAGTQVKLFGNYPLPWWGVQLSGSLQNLPGPSRSASLSYTSAQIAPSLGRPLSSGATGNVSVSILYPQTQFEPRVNQLDLRVTKTIRVQKFRVQGQFDAYNVFNSSTVLASSGTYGAAWLRPSSVLGARLVKFGVQLDWR